MSAGYVVEKRGREERPGQHEPILSEAQYRATLAAIAARNRAGNKPRPFRHYLLRGLVWGTCGTKMRGEAHVQRGTDRRYYRCPKVGCRARRCPAEPHEETVLTAIAKAVLPDEVIDRARSELQARLRTPAVPVPARRRKRLLTRLEQIKKQHGWGDIDDAEYQTKRDAVRAALRELPDDDRVRAFDAYRTRLLALPEAIAAASPERREELCRIVLERVVVDDREIESIIWTPPAAPFFDRQRWCPQGVLEARERRSSDTLVWYAEAAEVDHAAACRRIQSGHPSQGKVDRLDLAAGHRILALEAMLAVVAGGIAEAKPADWIEAHSQATRSFRSPI